MSKRRTERTLQPGTDCECHGSRVVYADSRAGVRSVAAQQPAVALVQASTARDEPAVLRWLVTMTTETVVAVVGDVPDPLGELADVTLDGPVTTAVVRTLLQRRDGRRAYTDAVERYFRALERGADRQELDAVRTATDECAAALDAADRLAVLDAIGG